MLNPRDIPEVKISLARVPAQKIWLRCYRENELDRALRTVLAHTEFTRYVVVSDDVIVSADAYAAVVDLLQDADGHFVTGYCNLDALSGRAGLVRQPLRGDVPVAEAYDWWTFEEISEFPPVFETWFTPMCLTGAHRDDWLEFGLEAFPSAGGGWCATDFVLSKKLERAEVPIWAVKDALCWHLKTDAEVSDTADSGRKALLHDRVPPHTFIEAPS